jgi:hypothetical protein
MADILYINMAHGSETHGEFLLNTWLKSLKQMADILYTRANSSVTQWRISYKQVAYISIGGYCLHTWLTALKQNGGFFLDIWLTAQIFEAKMVDLL